MDILGIIPARGGSQGFPKKNIKLLLGKPVIAYTIIAARRSQLITRLTVSTEDREIAEISQQYGAEVIFRPVELAADNSPIEDALRHTVTYLKEKEGYSPDIIVQMQANVPIRKEGMIDKVIKKLIDTKADSAISIYEVDQIPELMKTLDGDKLKPKHGLPDGYRRQDFSSLYLADGAVMVTRTDVLFETIGDKRAHAYLGNNVSGVVQEKYYTIELDSPEDLVLAEAVMSVLDAKNK